MPKPLTDSAARATILRALSEWPSADLLRLAHLISLGLPSAVVTNGPAIVIAPGDKRGGRDNMPGESMRAAVLHAWREVSRECGVPMRSPHDGEGGGREG